MSKEYDLVSAMMDFENGLLPEAQVDELFQFLVDNGIAWQLQGSYGRMAESLIRLGRIKKKEDA